MRPLPPSFIRLASTNRVVTLSSGNCARIDSRWAELELEV
jgi:hypothetical protein